MKLKGINSSSRKTKELIGKTFAELISEKKEIKSITVTELVKRADITRGAFYSHYDNIYQVASEFEEEIVERFFSNEITITSKEELFSYFDKIFNFLKEHQNIYSKLLTSNESMLFMNRLSRKIYITLAKIINKQTNPLNIVFFTDGTMTLIIKYFRKEIPQTLEEIFAYIKKTAELIFFA